MDKRTTDVGRKRTQTPFEKSRGRKPQWCSQLSQAFYFLRFRLRMLLTEKNKQKEIGSSIFRMFSPRRYCRYRIYLGCVLFRSSFSQPCHTSPCAPGGLLRCQLSLPGALFLRFVLFSLTRCGVASPGR